MEEALCPRCETNLLGDGGVYFLSYTDLNGNTVVVCPKCHRILQVIRHA